MNTAPPPRQAFIGAGANLGDRAATLASAVQRLQTMRGVLAAESSSIYETEPMGVLDQPKFLNLVVGIETALMPEELLEVLLEVEGEFGRVRRERWGPRTLDLDLLVFEDETRATAALQLPHPRMFERSFVTVPLHELLERPRFASARWAALRAKIGRPKIGNGIAVFSREIGGERS